MRIHAKLGCAELSFVKILLLCCFRFCGYVILSFISKTVVVYVLIPAPMVLVGIKGSDGEMNLWVQFGYCLGGFVLSCLFGKINIYCDHRVILCAL